MIQDLEKIGRDWVIAAVDEIDTASVYYCQNRKIIERKEKIQGCLAILTL